MDRENENPGANDDAQNSDQKSRTRTVSEDGESKANNSEKRPCIDIPMPVQHNGFQFPVVPASPPKFVSMEHITQAADVFSNMALAHEIAVNEDFILQSANAENKLQKQVKEVVHKAFWSVFEEQLREDPPNYSQAIVLLGEIKVAIMEILLPHQTRIKNHINEVLDLELIQQKLENDALDFHYYAKFIISLMSRLCAPVRDDKIQELSELTEIVPIYKGILETLHLMKLDMANFTLQQMRPHIQQHSVEYERKKFGEFLAALKDLSPPVDGLELTRKWLQSVYNKLLNLDNEQTSSSTKPEISDAQLITKAYLDMLQWQNDVLLPETLQMDQARLGPLKDQFTTILLSASILLVTYSIVGDSIHGISTLKSQLKDQLFILLKGSSMSSAAGLQLKLEGIALQIIKEVSQCLEEHGFEQLSDSKTALITSQVREIQSDNHEVKKLIKTRLLEFMEQILSATNATMLKFPIGLSAFRDEMASLSGQFLRLVNHNRLTFTDIYTDLLTDIRKQKAMAERHVESLLLD